MAGTSQKKNQKGKKGERNKAKIFYEIQSFLL